MVAMTKSSAIYTNTPHYLTNKNQKDEIMYTIEQIVEACVKAGLYNYQIDQLEKCLAGLPSQNDCMTSLPLLQAVLSEIMITDADFFEDGEVGKRRKIKRYQSIIQFVGELESEGNDITQLNQTP